MKDSFIILKLIQQLKDSFLCRFPPKTGNERGKDRPVG